MVARSRTEDLMTSEKAIGAIWIEQQRGNCSRSSRSATTTQGNWVKFKKTDLKKLTILDPRRDFSLTQLEALSDLYDRVSGRRIRTLAGDGRLSRTEGVG